jgi:hypothetical protein
MIDDPIEHRAILRAIAADVPMQGGSLPPEWHALHLPEIEELLRRAPHVH